jgi:hypothetical protein
MTHITVASVAAIIRLFIAKDHRNLTTLNQVPGEPFRGFIKRCFVKTAHPF